jgi:hypothetical protein
VQDASSLVAQTLLETAPNWQHAGQVIAQTDCAGSVDDDNVLSKAPAIYRLGHTADYDGGPGGSSRRGTAGDSVISMRMSSLQRRQESIASGHGNEASLSFRVQSGQHPSS